MGGFLSTGFRLALAAAPLTARAKPPSPTPPPPRTECTNQCSRSISRAVRKQLEKEVLRPANKSGITAWPPGCPLDPQIDLYGFQEKQKQHRRAGTPGVSWTCALCGKAFKSEHYLDLHLERHHMNVTPSGGVCLADYCEIFEVCHGDSRYKQHRARDAECVNSTMEMARKRCTNAMSKCFPLNEPLARQLYAQHNRHWCQVLDCGVRAERKREQERAHIPVAVLIILIILACFIFFIIMVSCVDYSDDILEFMKAQGLCSDRCLRRARTTRDATRAQLNLQRTRAI